jgi:sialate O-acetylesterase
MRRIAICFLALLLSVPALRADVKPHALVSEGMVLQQGVKCPIWGTCDKDENVTVTFEVPDQGISYSGQFQSREGKWRFDLPALKAGGPYALTIKGKNTVTLKDVLIGEVWVASGQSNMQWSINAGETPKEIKDAAKHPKIRLFTVPNRPADEPQKEVMSKWVHCTPDTVGNFSAVAYHFGVALHKARHVPVGIIHSSWGGTICEAWAPKGHIERNAEIKHLWDNYQAKYPKTLADYLTALAKYNLELEKHKKEGTKPPATLKAPNNPANNPNRPAVLYNGMIANLQPYAIKGAIWYQGESNAGRAYQYRTLFPAMIQSWRDTWNNPEMPFLFVQLAPFMKIEKEPQESAWAELREAQLMTLKLKNTGMAVITDIGDPKDIHPKPKKPVGDRLALAARGIAYGEPITYSGPLYTSNRINDNKMILSFKSVGKGLEAREGELMGFTIAGEDKKFYNAKAVIEGNTVVVSCDKVTKPAAVRYGWANCPVVNLWNKDGLPASPFRTDASPGVTADKK